MVFISPHLLTDAAFQSICLALFLVVLLDVLTGAAAAIKHGSFQLKMLADFASTHVLPGLAIAVPALFVAVASGQADPGTLLIGHGALAPFYASQIASIVSNLDELVGGDGEGPVLAMALGLVRRVLPDKAVLPQIVDGSQGASSGSSSPAPVPAAPLAAAAA